MGSLSDVYEHHVGPVQSSERLYFGTGLFLLGFAGVLTALISATTGVPELFGLVTWQAWEYAGVVGGLGFPLMLIGLFSVLPSTQKRKQYVAGGSVITAGGVLLFFTEFPYRWHGDAVDHTALVSFVYFIGIAITFWYTFRTIATFKIRNNPGGTVDVNVENRIESRQEQESTQTQSLSTAAVSPSENALDNSEDMDGGELLESEPTEDTPDPTDQYCGNCKYFRYEDGASGMVRYCGFYGEKMEDMEPCENWRKNTDP